jgi:hypothetical protein
MKHLFFILALMFLFTGVNAQNKLRTYPLRDKYIVVYRDTTNMTNLVSNALDETYYLIDSSFYFTPAISMTALKFNSEDYNIGAIPGIGYGMNWKPNKFKNLDCDALFSVTVYVQAGIVVDEGVDFTGDLSLMFGVWDNKFAVGPMYNIDTKSWYMGVSTALVKF